MTDIKLFDSELKIMNIVWENEPVTAKEVSLIAKKSIGWNKNTTYTVIKKLIEKDIILRNEPNFICTSLIKKEDIRRSETRILIDKLYDGSKKAFFASFIKEHELSEKEIEELKEMIEKR